MLDVFVGSGRIQNTPKVICSKADDNILVKFNLDIGNYAPEISDNIRLDILPVVAYGQSNNQIVDECYDRHSLLNVIGSVASTRNKDGHIKLHVNASKLSISVYRPHSLNINDSDSDELPF